MIHKNQAPGIMLHKWLPSATTSWTLTLDILYYVYQNLQKKIYFWAFATISSAFSCFFSIRRLSCSWTLRSFSLASSSLSSLKSCSYLRLRNTSFCQNNSIFSLFCFHLVSSEAHFWRNDWALASFSSLLFVSLYQLATKNQKGKKKNVYFFKGCNAIRKSSHMDCLFCFKLQLQKRNKCGIW